jgi:mannose-6-phosphate isomerase-like protein (cupin superfamily)
MEESMTAVLALLLALQQTPAPATPTPAPAKPPAQAPARRPAASSTVQVRVTDRSGTPLEGVQVTAEGPVSREGVTSDTGQVQFRTMTSGTYRIRASNDTFITLEKEVAIRAGATSAPIELALTPAPPAPEPPPAPAPPPAPPAASASEAKAGEPRVLSVADLAERSLGGRDAIRRVPVGCSGLDNTEMIVLRETLNAPANQDVDETIYVVAGEAMLSMDGRDQPLSSGWFVLVPRGMAHTIVRRGRNPAILLSTIGGQPCADANAK